MKKLVIALALTALSTSSWGTVMFGDGGATLNGALNDIHTDGTNSVDVVNDQISPDELWEVGGSGGSVSTLIIELAGFAGSNSFGIYDSADPSQSVELMAGSATTGSQALLSILADGSVFVNFMDTAVDFAANVFGFYLDTPNGTFYSETDLNADGVDHMAAYQGTGEDIQIAPFAAGPWGANEYILAWEDLYGGGDRDYADFVVLVESVSPVSAPATLALFGLGLLGLSIRARKKQS